MEALLQLQALDLQIERRREREEMIPKQKNKFDIHRQRLAQELQEREKVVKALILEQRECERDNEAKQTQINKWNTQLLSVKKNEEYTALLHEIDLVKKQMAANEERILKIMVGLDDARARLEEDKKRIQEELKDIDRECLEIDKELAEAVGERKLLEVKREPLTQQVPRDLLARYTRIRSRKKSGPAVVPLRGETCSGCNMTVTPQIVNELLAGDKVHACRYCGRLLYDTSQFGRGATEASEA